MEILINPRKKKRGRKTKKKKSRKNPVENAVLSALSGNPSNPLVLVNPKISVSENPRKRKKKKGKRARKNPSFLQNLTKKDNLIWIGAGFGANWFIGDKLPDPENIPVIGNLLSSIPNSKKVLIPAGSFIGTFFVKGKMKKNLQNIAIGSGIDYIIETFIMKRGQLSGLEQKEEPLLPPPPPSGQGSGTPIRLTHYEEIPVFTKFKPFTQERFFEKLRRLS